MSRRKNVKKYVMEVSPMRLAWNTAIFVGMFVFDASFLLGKPLMRLIGDPTTYKLNYLWFAPIKNCVNKECAIEPPKDPPIQLQVVQVTEGPSKGVWVWECPACGTKAYPHFIEAQLEIGTYGKIELKQMMGTRDEFEKAVREAWNMCVAYIDAQHKGMKDRTKKIRGIGSG